LLAPVTVSGGGHLDSTGRWFLATFDYQIWGLVIVSVFVFFSLWRRWRYRSWPVRNDYVHLLFSLAGCIGGVTIPVVFLLTKPPALDMLSGPLFLLIGLGVPILIFGEAIPRLKTLFLPPEAPRPPQDQNTLV
jgi:hypothetical protein